VRADGDAARCDEHVRLEPRAERVAVRLLVVGHRRQPVDHAPGRASSAASMAPFDS
jgi:hypothetical protein